MLPGVKQSNCADIRYTSESLWRRETFLSDGLIAGQLRMQDCDVTGHMRMLGAAATRDVEDYLKIGIQLQVRELRLNRFPFRRDPIILDYRTAWNATEWAELAAESSSSTSEAVDAIEALFGDEDPPLSIRYGVCCDSDEEVFDAENYVLKRSDQGDTICLVDDACWPASCCSTGCDYVRIRYVVGYFSSSELVGENPKLIQNILATFGYMNENPELMSTAGNVYQSAILKSRLGSKWRV